MRRNSKSIRRLYVKLTLAGAVAASPLISGCARSPREHLAHLLRSEADSTQTAEYEKPSPEQLAKDTGIRRASLFADAEDSADKAADDAGKGSLPGRLFRSLIDRRPKKDGVSQDPFLVSSAAATPKAKPATTHLPPATHQQTSAHQTTDSPRQRLLDALESRPTTSVAKSSADEPWWRQEAPAATSVAATPATPAPATPASRSSRSRMASTTSQKFSGDFDSRLESLRSELLPAESSPESVVATADVHGASKDRDLDSRVIEASATMPETQERNPFAELAASSTTPATQQHKQDEVRELMDAARQDLEGWRLASAQQHALDAYHRAAMEGTRFAPGEESPADLLARVVKEKQKDDATRQLAEQVAPKSPGARVEEQTAVASVNTAAFKNFPNVFGESGWQSVSGLRDSSTVRRESSLLRHPFAESTESANASELGDVLGAAHLPDATTLDDKATAHSDESARAAECPEVCANECTELSSSSRDAFLAHVGGPQSRSQFGLAAAEELELTRTNAASNRSRVLERDPADWMSASSGHESSTFDRSRPVRVAAAPPLHSEPVPAAVPADAASTSDEVVKGGWIPSGSWIVLLMLLGAAIVARVSPRRWRLSR